VAVDFLGQILVKVLLNHAGFLVDHLFMNIWQTHVSRMMQWILLKMTIFVIAFFSPCIYDM